MKPSPSVINYYAGYSPFHDCFVQFRPYGRTNADIIDVSPTRLNTNANDIGHSVTGRMLSIACSPDGTELYAGSYSDMWVSEDGGQKWEQLTWQPDPSQFNFPRGTGRLVRRGHCSRRGMAG
jgi:hypothetical protein